MRFLSVMMKPAAVSEQVEKRLGIICALLLLGAASAYFILLCGAPMIVCAAALLLGAGMLLFRGYRLPFRSPLIAHCISLYVGYLSLGSVQTDAFPSAGTAAVSFLCWFGASEYLLGAAAKLLGCKPHPELFLRSLFISVSFFFTVCLFLSSETYFSNESQLRYVYWDFFRHYLLHTLFLSVSAAVFICSFRKKAAWLLSCILTGLLLCVYCQYMFMNTSLPLIGAEKIDWDGLKQDYLPNALIWAGIFAAPLSAGAICRRLKRRKKSVPDPLLINTVAAGGLGLIQFLTLVVLFVTNKDVMADQKAMIPYGDDQFVVSANKNIVTFILDMADQSAFESAYAERPEAFGCLKDFTYYTNTAMLYDSTFQSVPSMLTAARYYAEEEDPEWYEKIRNDAPAVTFYDRLHQAGYAVNVYGDFMFDFSPMDGCFDNLRLITRQFAEVNSKALYDSINTVNTYRALPLCLKRFSEPSVTLGNNAVRVVNQSVTDNSEFLEKTELTADSSKNYFIVQHLIGLHGDPDEKTQVTECLALLEQYFSQMKQLGVYDDALIIVTADHGYHNQPKNMPIWYIKVPHTEQDAIRFCNAPISLTDYAATVLQAAGLSQDGDEALFGRSIFEIAEDERRERMVFQRQPFCTNETGYFFGYKYTGTKEDLSEHEMHDPPDWIIKRGK